MIFKSLKMGFKVKFHIKLFVIPFNRENFKLIFFILILLKVTVKFRMRVQNLEFRVRTISVSDKKF
jgi:hypothetical protein